MRFLRFIPATIAALTVLAAFPATGARAAPESEITIFAAASTSNAITEIAEAWKAAGNGHVRMVFASSGVLARQIDSGAPADLYLSANRRWMDWLVARNMIDGEPTPLLGNRLVLIQPADAASPLVLDDTLAGRLAGERLAIGDPDHVPAGLYARAALESLGLWPALAPRTARMQSVRAALLLVERGEAAAGIVYASDAAASRRVTVAATIPADSHPPIVYPAGVVTGNKSEAARRLLAYLRGPEASAVFREHGFEAAGAP